MIDGRGPTLLVIDRCFLFRTHPNYGLYMATGYNTNFMYLNLNMQTLPNGLEREHLAKKSILDKDPESKAMLELLGRGPVSEGLREGDENSKLTRR
nr:hypothetical protein BaRGS_033983 [Batillaria attramentaria]